MNKKFSTLMAVFLAAGATFTAEAGVVKVTTPVNGKQYVIGVKDAVTSGKFTAATQILMTNANKDGVDVAVAPQNATTLDAFTQWFFNSTTADQYRISLEASAKYLAASSDVAMTITDGVEGTNVAKDTWMVSGDKLGADFDGTTTVDCSDQITFTPAVASAGTVALSASGSDIAFYAETYDEAEETIGGMTFNLKNSVADNEFVFIKIGDKFVSVNAAGDAIEMVSADALKTTLGKYRATFKVSDSKTKYIAIAASSADQKLKAGASTNDPLTIDGTGTAFYFDESNTYIGQKGASMYTAASAADFVGVDGKTTVIGGTTPSQRPEVKIYKSSNLLMAPASSTNPLISAENFVSGGKYLLSANGTNFQKVASVALDGKVTLGVTTSISIDEDAMWEVKQTKDASGNYSYTLYNVGQKVYLKLATGTTTFISGVEKQGYTGGLILVASDGKALDSSSGSAAADLQAVDGSSDQIFGLYDAGFKPYSQGELAALENGAFSMTIAIDKDNVGKKTIKGADIFAGSLTPVAATASATCYQLKDADGKYIVLTKTAWGAQNSLNGVDNKGFKFAKVAEADKDKADYYSWFEINYPLVKGKTYEELIVQVYDAVSTGNLQGRLFISEVDKNYYLTVAKAPLAAGEVWAYAQTGGSTLVDLKTFIQKGKFYTVALVNEDYQIEKVLGTATGGEAALLDKGAVQMDQPEGQWAASVVAGKLVLTNRESQAAYDKLGILYSTDKDNVYKNGDKLYLINAVEKHAATDGYEAWTNEQLRDEQYTFGFYSNVLGAAAYLSENHSNKHLIGLEKDIKNATSWNVKAFDAKRMDAAQTDSVYVISNLYFWNKDKKGGADWDFVADTLKTVSYKFINAANGEPVKFSSEENAYVCDKDKAVDNAPRFAIKKMADGKYNVVAVKANGTLTATDKYYVLGGNKLYGGFSVAQGNVNATGMYNKSENDLVVLEKTAAPEYVKRNMGDTIRIFREGAEASILFEKGEFLGLENIHEFTKMAPAMYVDTAYYNRGTNNRWQYLLGVEIDRKVVNDDCGVPSHEKFHADTTYGRFLVNLVDSAELYKKTHLHDNKYVNTEGYAKLGFVKGFHTNDTLIIQRNGVLIPAKEDSIYMGSKDFNVAKFAFRIVDHSTNAFKIETLYKKYSDGPAGSDDKLGYLKWMNGYVVVVDAIENGDTFNLEADPSDPTANDNITASSISVVATDGAVIINGAAGKTVSITNMVGQTIANRVLSSDNETVNVSVRGVVIVSVEGESAVKAIVK